jgi:hypothetical protein
MEKAKSKNHNVLNSSNLKVHTSNVIFSLQFLIKLWFKNETYKLCTVQTSRINQSISFSLIFIETSEGKALAVKIFYLKLLEY